MRSDNSKEYRIYYRHTGQSDPGEEWFYKGAQELTLQQIEQEVGRHHITHMCIQFYVPPDLHKLAPHLTHLRLWRLTEDSSHLEWIGELEDLQELSVWSSDHLLTLPDSIGNLQKLTSLEVFNNDSLKLLPERMGNLQKLTSLRVSDSHNLESLPESLGKLQELTNLYLDRNIRLESLPESIGNLQKLTSLRVHENNNLKSLPKSIGNLQKLTSLRVHENNNLKSLPKSIGNLQKLTSLKIRENSKLKSLPESIGKLHGLTELSIGENLESLPESIENLHKLKSLSIYSNSKLHSFPESVGKLQELIELNISDNRHLESLPESIGNLQKLTSLVISYNYYLKSLPERIFVCNFCEQPSEHSTFVTPNCGKKNCAVMQKQAMYGQLSLGNLEKLTHLDLGYNNYLESLPESICDLRSLEYLDVIWCNSMRSPPKEVCERGIESIRQYFKDLASGSEKTTPAVTVAVIGQTMAGKTSLIKTLQSEAKERVLTHRGPDATLDESTRVFNVQQVKADDALLRFIDVGGQDVYHSTYQLTFRNSCIPLVVASIKHFDEMRQVEGINALEAVRLLCFDWLAQIYVACPKLGPPKLVFTHLDKVSQNRFEELKSDFLTTCQILKEAVMEDSKLVTDGDQVSLIDHFVLEENVFLPKDIYSVGKSTDYSVFEDIIENLRIDCMARSKKIPSIWKKISDALDSCEGAVVNMSDLLAKLRDCDVVKRQLEVVLTYLVDCGKVLWYPSTVNIQENIFHSIEKVTCLIGILFAHDDSKCWSERIENFKPFISSSGLIIHKKEFHSMYALYKASGVMPKDILSYLIEKESDFKKENELKIALSLLGHFRLIFGPVDHKGQPGFILPYFTSGYQSESLATKHNEMRLHADMALQGMTVPRHVYQEISIGVMQFFPHSTDSVVLCKNGLTAYKDGISLCLTHDYKSKSITFEVVGESGSVYEMWEMAISLTDSAAQHLKTSWKAAHHTISFTCAHCLLVGNQHPAKVINPKWLRDRTSPVEPMIKVMCKSDIGFPACLNHPCKPLSREDIAVLDEYIKERKSKDTAESSGVSHITTDQSMKGYACDPREVNKPVPCSDRSDRDESIAIRTGQHHVSEILQVPEPTTDPDTQCLFNDTDQVFKMTCPIRGRALIINMENFSGSNGTNHHRKGSDKDVKAMKQMLEAFKFEVGISQDLTAEEIISDIVMDHKDYGMFFLCIMSHGKQDGIIMGSDHNGVKLIDICDTLSPTLFPAMAGKPKLIVIQACGGDKRDKVTLVCDTPSEDLGTRPKTAAIPASTARDNQLGPVLNADDFFIFRSSFESYVSYRVEESGALLIRCLIKTFYEHACNKDMHSLYKMIQERVREDSMKLTGEQQDKCSGQTVIAIDTLSRQRKLYLFPGYNPLPSTPPRGAAA